MSLSELTDACHEMASVGRLGQVGDMELVKIQLLRGEGQAPRFA